MQKLCPNCDVPLLEAKIGHFQCIRCPFNAVENDSIMENLYAWVSVDKVTGMEGLIALDINGTYMAAISSRLSNVEKMEQSLRGSIEKTGHEIRLVEFRRVKVLK